MSNMGTNANTVLITGWNGLYTEVKLGTAGSAAFNAYVTGINTQYGTNLQTWAQAGWADRNVFEIFGSNCHFCGGKEAYDAGGFGAPAFGNGKMDRIDILGNIVEANGQAGIIILKAWHNNSGINAYMATKGVSNFGTYLADGMSSEINIKDLQVDAHMQMKNGNESIEIISRPGNDHPFMIDANTDQFHAIRYASNPNVKFINMDTGMYSETYENSHGHKLKYKNLNFSVVSNGITYQAAQFLDGHETDNFPYASCDFRMNKIEHT